MISASGYKVTAYAVCLIDIWVSIILSIVAYVHYSYGSLALSGGTKQHVMVTV